MLICHSIFRPLFFLFFFLLLIYFLYLLFIFCFLSLNSAASRQHFVFFFEEEEEEEEEVEEVEAEEVTRLYGFAGAELVRKLSHREAIDASILFSFFLLAFLSVCRGGRDDKYRVARKAYRERSQKLVCRKQELFCQSHVARH